MRTETVEDFLQERAARVPAPGGGASAALHAAQAAALLSMVARYSDGEKYADHAATVQQVCDTADELRALCLDLAERDAEAFGAVAAAYTLPKQSPEEKQERSAAIAAALAEAGRVPGRVIALAAHLVELAELMRPVGNANVISDVAAAAIAARAAVSTARVNVEINLAGITDPDVRAELEETVVKTDDTLLRADTVTSAVREQILR
ncbi:cyclodeaminase/cyclohydrolase family protein [Prauserella rugosa]|uniref:Formiminotetrahydrofolate cyclodeaminase n=1 Tax=Prauserella rugosa TaxID=43354 RepID=A0A660CB40_9PSEU|nr:cyclodeaminase/cyclohydrolase family protein [Prauserella rugosa]KMS69313.1 formimidoyltetrahydrofolate cyclodeaminase [Streptomyces regensis]TWH18739.1 formiminotetrahydrofolate cyclodeaminase [Prauserella rugosa]